MTTAAANNPDRQNNEEGTPYSSRWHDVPLSFILPQVTVRQAIPGDAVVSSFGSERWRNIFTDIGCDKALDDFLARNSDTCRAYLLLHTDSGEPFGWIFLRRRDPIMCDTVEFHGGAWRDSYMDSLGKFRAAIAVISALLQAGIQVSSRAYRTNSPALRFLEAIGFRQIQRPSSRPWVSLRLSRKRFAASPVVRRLAEASQDS